MVLILENAQKYCCEDISNIENYQDAINSPETYDIHHRLETEDEFGNRLSVSKTYKDLIKEGKYYNVPAKELIFLSHSEHQKLHLSFENRKEINSKNMKEINLKITHNKGKRIKRTKEHNKRISDSIKKLNQRNNVGTHWYTNGEITIRAKDCLKGFHLGRK